MRNYAYHVVIQSGVEQRRQMALKDGDRDRLAQLDQLRTDHETLVHDLLAEGQRDGSISELPTRLATRTLPGGSWVSPSGSGRGRNNQSRSTCPSPRTSYGCCSTGSCPPDCQEVIVVRIEGQPVRSCGELRLGLVTQPFVVLAGPVTVGLVGHGAGGRWFHAPSIAAADGIELAGVVARSAEWAAEARADLPGVPVFWSLAEMLDSGVDAVTIATPPATRHELAREASVHVVVDKPFVPTAAEGANSSTRLEPRASCSASTRTVDGTSPWPT